MEKKNKSMVYTVVGVIILLLIIVIVGIMVSRNKGNGSQTELVEEEVTGEEGTVTSTAMYISFTEDSYLLVDQDTGSVFTVTFPEELYNSKGEKITRDQLVKGNVLKIYGDGIMLESYPGQYPGVTKMEVIKDGTPADADTFLEENKELVDMFTAQPDPAEPPILNVEYTTDLAAVSSVVNRGGYEWTYLDTDGTSNSVVADSTSVLMWSDELLNAVKLTAPVDMTLNFSEEPEEITVVRWSSEWRNKETDVPEGEPVETAEKDGKTVMTGVEAGYVYMITAVWENGRAEFGFLTIS